MLAFLLKNNLFDSNEIQDNEISQYFLEKQKI